MNRRLFLAIAVVAAVALAPHSTTAQGRDPAKLRVTLLPDENAATVIQNAQPLKAHLEAALRKEIEIVVTTDYSSMIEAMRFGRIEIAYFGPFSYVLAKSRAPEIETFAVGVERGAPTYNSILIATRDGPIKSIDDIKGKPFAFGDQASTSSHLAPRAHLVKHGLVGEKDYKPIHLGTHDAVARAVQAGQVPAGALSEPIFRTLVARNVIDEAKIVKISLSDPILNYPIVMQGNLAPALKEGIRRAFLDLKDKEILRSFRVEGFAPSDDKAYDSLREMARLLDLDLAKMN
ncbi:MAG: phosphate/phosphite/phosphonate ABC transporter substrate-binding protein [Alphaproteobacteria bacterium]|nr:phosphate/phosphite/phosphonate ABC transporter substrate-binding protein [Alphaproteobacteria bacterium]